RDFEVVECADPGGTAVGAVIRDLLLDRRRQMTLPCEMFLFMASRAQLTAEVIGAALDAGRAVVADRYLLANVVYQGHAGGLDPEQLWQVGDVATGGLMRDCVFVLDMTIKSANLRMNRSLDRMESQGDAYREHVRQGFLTEVAR